MTDDEYLAAQQALLLTADWWQWRRELSLGPDCSLGVQVNPNGVAHWFWLTVRGINIHWEVSARRVNRASAPRS